MLKVGHSDFTDWNNGIIVCIWIRHGLKTGALKVFLVNKKMVQSI